MKGTAITAEFNPFHMGHKYIIEEAKRRTDCDFLGVVMSGSFCQRGEPAVFDKFLRTKAALLNGADIVIELPVIYATGAADIFAGGAVGVIAAANIFSHIAFGTEAKDIAQLAAAAEILADEPAEFKATLKKFVGEGLSYPKARELALCEVSALPQGILSQPNNILAAEYLKALRRLKSPIIPVAVPRKGGGYNDESFSGKFSSAAAVRKAMGENNLDKLKAAVPESIYPYYEKAIKESAPTLETYAEVLRYLILKSKREDLSEISDITEGLENKIYQNADFENVNDLIAKLKSKRYTQTKLTRALLHILLDIKKQDVIPLPPPPYIRVLGIKKEKKEIISALVAAAKVPVIINVKKDSETLNEEAKNILRKEIFATGLRLAKNKTLDLTEGLIVM